MSTTDTSHVTNHRAETDTPTSPRVPRNRRTGVWIAAGVLVVAGTVGNAALINALADRAPVLVLARDVSWGQRISAEDVQPVSLPASVGRYAVSESERAQVIGRTAAENLHAGQLLGRRDTTLQAVPGPRQRVIGVRLETGRSPHEG